MTDVTTQLRERVKAAVDEATRASIRATQLRARRSLARDERLLAAHAFGVRYSDLYPPPPPVAPHCPWCGKAVCTAHADLDEVAQTA